MFSIYELILWFAVSALIAYWWRISGQKQQVLEFARRYCTNRGLQLLDQTLVFRRYALERNQRGRLQLRRHYDFDFSSDGENRFQGEAVLDGRKVVRIVLEAEQTEVAEF